MTATDTPEMDFSVDPLLIDSVTRLLSDTCTFDAVQAAEEAGWAPEIWQSVAEAGYPWIGLPVEAGGSGGTLRDAVEVIRLAGAHAAPIPLAETMLTGGWLLTEAGLELPDGPVTVVPGTSADTLEGRLDGADLVINGDAHRVPWAGQADRIAVLIPVRGAQMVASVLPGEVVIASMANVAGEPRPTVHVRDVRIPIDRVAPVDHPRVGDQLRLRGALGRTAAMAGALEAMSRLTVDYTDQRHQFGRPVSRFQAVQQHLVWGAQDAALASMAATVAAAHAEVDVLGAGFQIAAARAVTEEVASTATRWAHQAHGAMGMTQEYALHHLSRRLWSWRHEFATPGEWRSAVGRMAEAAGPDGLYPLIAS
ncbi:MAG: acyl-CoA dehydrogenase family protein [Actinomycetota bacterium]